MLFGVLESCHFVVLFVDGPSCVTMYDILISLDFDISVIPFFFFHTFFLLYKGLVNFISSYGPKYMTILFLVRVTEFSVLYCAIVSLLFLVNYNSESVII